MPDIAMCINEDCPIKSRCYRYTATPSTPQSFSLFHWDGIGCDHFWPNASAARRDALESTHSE